MIDVVTSKAREIVESRVQVKVPAIDSSPAKASPEDGQELGEGAVALTNGDTGNAAAEPGSSVDLQVRPSEGLPSDEHLEASTSGSEGNIDPPKILLSLPNEELCQLCLLLAREGYISFSWMLCDKF